MFAELFEKMSVCLSHVFVQCVGLSMTIKMVSLFNYQSFAATICRLTLKQKNELVCYRQANPFSLSRIYRRNNLWGRLQQLYVHVKESFLVFLYCTSLFKVTTYRTTNQCCSCLKEREALNFLDIWICSVLSRADGTQQMIKHSLQQSRTSDWIWIGKKWLKRLWQ